MSPYYQSPTFNNNQQIANLVSLTPFHPLPLVGYLFFFIALLEYNLQPRYNAMVLDKFRKFYNHHHKPVLDHFIIPQGPVCP